jgi:hypothetical protein
VLIIDDAQETEAEVERIIERLVWLAPDSLRLVHAREPRMPLARRGREDGEVGAATWFTVGEARLARPEAPGEPGTSSC